MSDLGWGSGDVNLIARYLVGGVPSPAFWAVRLNNGTWWFVINTISGDQMELFFDSFFPTYADAAAAGELEPDPIPAI